MLVISVIELRAGARGWVMAGPLGVWASLGLAKRGVPAESAVDVWAVLCGVVFGGLGGRAYVDD